MHHHVAMTGGRTAINVQHMRGAVNGSVRTATLGRMIGFSRTGITRESNTEYRGPRTWFALISGARRPFIQDVDYRVIPVREKLCRITFLELK